MQGVVFLSQHSIDTTSWPDIFAIDNSLEEIRIIIECIASCGYAQLQVPVDWYSGRNDGKDFFEFLLELCEQDSMLFSDICSKIQNRTFYNCINKGLLYADAHSQLTKNNPDYKRLEYYGAVRGPNLWPDVSEELHIAGEADLYNWAIKFLSEHPASDASFSSRSIQIFKNIKFHSGFSETLAGHGVAGKEAKYTSAKETGIKGFSNSVVTALQVLNDIDLLPADTNEILKAIEGKSGLECRGEGKDKARLKTNWGDDGIGEVSYEYHLKIKSSNRRDQGDNTFYQDRLYFGITSIQGIKKILVYHSGQHL